MAKEKDSKDYEPSHESLRHWQELYERQPVHEAIDKLLEGLSSLALEDLTDMARQHLDRLLVACQHVKAALNSVNPMTVNWDFLEHAKNRIADIQAPVDAFAGSRDESQLAAGAGAAVSKLVDIISRLDVAQKFADSREVTKVALSFKDEAAKAVMDLKQVVQEQHKLMEDLSNTVGQMSENLVEVNTTIDQQKARLDQAISDHQKQFSEAEDRRREAADGVVKETRDKVSETVGQFTVKQGERDNEFRNQIDEFKKKIQEALDKHDSDASVGLEAIHTRTSEALEDIEGKLDEAKKTVGVIANVGITGDFKNQANKEKKSADKYTTLALLLMLVVVGGVAFSLFGAMEQGWQ